MQGLAVPVRCTQCSKNIGHLGDHTAKLYLQRHEFSIRHKAVARVLVSEVSRPAGGDVQKEGKYLIPALNVLHLRKSLSTHGPMQRTPRLLSRFIQYVVVQYRPHSGGATCL
eukprot:GFKZ01007648.1.p1 GENE.GFKZ01007648.1~~GFKZ01007648.1.p1  ORF type:complete len:112 (+),score=0.09 GFKZ01007648.1:9-344(+)